MMESRDDDYVNNNNNEGHDVDITEGSEAGTFETTLIKANSDAKTCTHEQLRRRTPRHLDALAYSCFSPSESESSNKENHQNNNIVVTSSMILDNACHDISRSGQISNDSMMSRFMTCIDDETEEEEPEIYVSQYTQDFSLNGNDTLEPEIELTKTYSSDSSKSPRQALNHENMDQASSPLSTVSSGSSSANTQCSNHSKNTTTNNPQTIHNQNRSNPSSPGIRSSFQAPYRPPTKLHEICQQAQNIKELTQARSELLKLKLPRKEILGFAAVRDGQQRTPLHLLAENSDLISDLIAVDTSTADRSSSSLFFPDLTGSTSAALLRPSSTLFDDTTDPTRFKIVERFIVDFLVMACPSACMSRDINGQIPFEGILAEWVRSLHDEMLHSQGLRRKSNRRRDSFVDQAAPQAKAVAKALRSTMSQAAKKTSQFLILSPPDRRKSQQPQPVLSSTRRSSLVKNPAAVNTPRSQRKEDSTAMDNTARNKCFPVHVHLSTELSFALKILSKMIERLELLSASPGGPSSQQQQQVSSSRSIPHLRREISSPSSLQGGDSFDRVMEESLASGKASCAYDEIRNSVVDSIASIEGFVKMVFLIENDEERGFALSTTIMKGVLLSKHSVGGWLTAMLQNREKRVSSRGVSYLKYVSDLSAADETANKSNASSNGASSSSVLSGTKRHRGDVHDEMSRLQDFVPSLLALGEKGMEEAATSMVVRRVMDRLISRPFAVTVIFFDTMFLALLLFGFRSAVNNLLVIGDPNKVMRGIYIANTGIFYFIIREIAKAISLCMITRRARYYVWSFWNITDVCATLLSLISVISIRATSRSEEGLDIIDKHGLRDLLALTTGFLWLRVLNMLKGINMQMATYILAILQITKDTLSFGVILFIMVITFAQMFYTVLVPDYCSDGDHSMVDPEYRCVRNEYIFKTYTILLGDFQTFDRDTFQTKFSVFLLVIYCFMVIIVLLNVLIALASDSYEKCLMKSQMLFGRARIMLVAELVCFQNLLRKTTDNQGSGNINSQGSTTLIDNSNHSNRLFGRWWTARSFAEGWSRGSVLFFALSSLVVLFWAVGETAGYFSGERYGNVAISMGSILINIVVFAAIMTFLSRGADSINLSASKRAESARGLSQSSSSDSSDSSSSSVRLPSCLQNFMLRIMGSSQDTWNFIRAERDPNREQNDWRGRVHHLQSQIELMAKDSQELSVKQAQALEQLVAATELRLKSDVAAVDQRVGDIKSDLLLEFKRCQEELLKQIQTATSTSTSTR